MERLGFETGLMCGKLDDDPDALLRNMAAAIKQVKPSRKWAERIILGCWNVSMAPTFISPFPQKKHINHPLGQVPSCLQQTPPRLPYSTHRLEHSLRATIPRDSRNILQHVPTNDDRPRRFQIHERRTKSRTCSLPLDGQ